MSDFPDYEAATKELADWLAEREGITDIANAAQSVVDVSLCDEPLYQVDKTHERKRTTDPVKYVRVWLKEISSE